MPDDSQRAHEALVSSLQERAKELNCLYHVEEVLRTDSGSLEDTFRRTIEAIPPGWQYPDICQVILTHGDRTFRSAEFEPTPWMLRAEITVQDSAVGTLEIYYLEDRPEEDTGPFLKEEVRLVNTIAELVGHFILRQHLLDLQKDWEALESGTTVDAPEIWRSPLHLLRESDRDLYLRIAHKLLNYLCQVGIPEARDVAAKMAGVDPSEGSGGEVNVPACRLAQDDAFLLSDGPFELASRHLSDAEILTRVQNWMQEDKASSFLKVLNNPRSPLPEIVDAMRRFERGIPDRSVLRSSTLKTLRVSLTQRLLTEQIDFVRVAKEHVEIEDFAELTDRMILPAGSHGRLGGKSAGLFIAWQILKRYAADKPNLGQVQIPKTWYITSDVLQSFLSYNDFEEILEQKYKSVEQIREEYPNIVQIFKNSL
ncbi:MAG: pyruvate, phosphate dikinase, partial [Candidatus Eisenbacteria sp.]|nr:pyruvate, phosphate dikinase [Candidatus Eisenbacteria bacterium]